MAHALPDNSGPTILQATFWADALERIVSTAGASALTAIPVAAPYADGIDLRAVAIGFGGGALVEFLRCLAASGRGNTGTASMLRATRSGAAPKLARFMGRGQ
ncbi:hypothetical protein ABW16_21665 [Mycolicibacter heraklionensis]|uniref:Uncharacterized protein n=1 Tax=Mycolicibacter heraklionensis TaxID=512402 RepID=A0ABR5FA51_9MYCO|nr:hypothetical protein [Mycolicibacter heraklionensis]KLO25916.1 hypothetical protein ABW16_21665 [Mycolicibacter heraklionensis]